MSSTQSSPTRGESSGGFFSHIQRTSSPSATCFERALAKSLSRKRGALKKMKRLLTHHKRSKKRFTRDARRVYISFCISVFLHFKTDAARVSPFLCRAKTVFLTSRHDVLREERRVSSPSQPERFDRALRDSSPIVSFFFSSPFRSSLCYRQ